MADEERLKAHNAYNRNLIALAEHRKKKFDEALKIQASVRKEVQMEQQAVLQRAQQAEAEDKKNWFDEGAQGASMGAVAGPWGALIGGIIGTGMGMSEAIGQRQSEGESTFSSIKNTLFDAPGFNFGEAASAIGTDEGMWDAGRAGGMKVDPMQAAQVGVMAYGGMGAGDAFEGDKSEANIPEGGYWDPDKMNASAMETQQLRNASQKDFNTQRDVLRARDRKALNTRQEKAYREKSTKEATDVLGTRPAGSGIRYS